MVSEWQSELGNRFDRLPLSLLSDSLARIDGHSLSQTTTASFIWKRERERKKELNSSWSLVCYPRVLHSISSVETRSNSVVSVVVIFNFQLDFEWARDGRLRRKENHVGRRRRRLLLQTVGYNEDRRAAVAVETNKIMTRELFCLSCLFLFCLFEGKLYRNLRK